MSKAAKSLPSYEKLASYGMLPSYEKLANWH